MPKRMILTEQEFRAAAKGDSVSSNIELRKAFVSEIKAVDDSRKMIIAISTQAVDRMGDTINVNGWKLDNYRKNSPVLWAHDTSMLPVGKSPRVWIEDGKLMAEADFTPTPNAWPKFNDSVYEMLKAGYLNAASVGFAPIKYAFSEEDGRSYGIDFIEQELLEFSIVPVPANPQCLVAAKSAGIDIEPILEWAGKAISAAGLSVIDRGRLDAIMALPEEFRATAKKLPDGAKGARGQLLRCANIAERTIKSTEDGAPEPIEEPAPPPEIEAPIEEPIKDTAGTPRLDMARRRLALLH